MSESCKSKVFFMVRANSKNKAEDLVFWISILLSRLASLLLHIIKHNGNVSLIQGRYRNPVTFQTKCLATKDVSFQHLTAVWRNSVLDLVGFLYWAQRYSSLIYISNIFVLEKMKYFLKSDISWHQQKTMGIIKYCAQLQVSRSWIIVICSFVVIYSNIIKKNKAIWKMRAFSQHM